MEVIKITIDGTTPLLCNRFIEIPKNMGGSSAVYLGDKGTPQEQAEKRLYLNENEKPVIPQPNMFRSIVDGGVFFKAGKTKVTTQKTSIIPACLGIEELEILIEHKDRWTVDTRPVVIPSTGGRIICHRPRFNDWKLSFTMQLDASLMSAKLLREIVDASGQRIGLGDFRPSRKGPFGKYKVVLWKACSA